MRGVLRVLGGTAGMAFELLGVLLGTSRKTGQPRGERDPLRGVPRGAADEHLRDPASPFYWGVGNRSEG